MLVAVTREVSPSIGRCELTHVARTPIDVAIAQAQHRGYQRCLAEAGCRVQCLPAAPDLPDSVFVEDTAVVFDELAIIARPGAGSRRAETEAIARVLASYRALCHIRAPGTLDGGDVLRVGRVLYVGLSARTNENAIAQLRLLVEPFSYEVRSVPVNGCLHLKSAVTQVGPNALLLNRAWVDPQCFDGLETLDVAPSEPMAANVLRVGDLVVCSSAYGKTRQQLEKRGIAVKVVDMSEFAKAEGGVTCCSLLVDVTG